MLKKINENLEEIIILTIQALVILFCLGTYYTLFFRAEEDVTLSTVLTASVSLLIGVIWLIKKAVKSRQGIKLIIAKTLGEVRVTAEVKGNISKMELKELIDAVQAEFEHDKPPEEGCTECVTNCPNRHNCPDRGFSS